MRNNKYEDGFNFINGKEHEYENYFQFRPEIINEVGINNQYSFKDFLTTCEALYYECEKVVNKFISSQTKIYNKLKNEVDFNGSPHTLRLLCYDYCYKKDKSALMHTDRSFLTLHLYQSIGGLKFKNNNYEPKINDDQIIFPGRLAKKLYPNYLEPLEHYVKSINTGEARIAIVFFAYRNLYQ